MVLNVLLAHFVMIAAKILNLADGHNPVALLGLKLPLREGVKIPARPHLQLRGAVVQPLQFGGLPFPAFLCKRLQPAAKAVMAGLNSVGYAVPLGLNRAQALRVAQFRYFAVAGVALQPGFLPREHPLFLPPVLVNQVVVNAAEFAVNVGGCLGSDVVGHDPL
jgi:hypothetical protein